MVLPAMAKHGLKPATEIVTQASGLPESDRPQASKKIQVLLQLADVLPEPFCRQSLEYALRTAEGFLEPQWKAGLLRDVVRYLPENLLERALAAAKELDVQPLSV